MPDTHRFTDPTGARTARFSRHRRDHMKLDDANWHCFTLSKYDRTSGKWAMEKAPVYHIID